MSDSDPDAPGDGPADANADGAPAGSNPERTESAETAGCDADGQGARLGRYVDYAVLAGLLLLAFVAVAQFYLAASSAIGTWVTHEYRAPFRAAFNLVVLSLAGLGVSFQLRRLRG